MYIVFYAKDGKVRCKHETVGNIDRHIGFMLTNQSTPFHDGAITVREWIAHTSVRRHELFLNDYCYVAEADVYLVYLR